MTEGWLRACDRPLAQTYDVALLDLDGVVYVGGNAVPGAADALASAGQSGLRLGFVTNNASRSSEAVAGRLREMGITAQESQVITSAQTAAGVMAERLAPGSRVLVVGTAALAAEISRVGLVPVTDPDPTPDAVVQGYSTETGWSELAAACRALRAGAWWVATNTDATVPSPYGPMPGNGAFVDVIARTTGDKPEVTGKPEPAMHQECVRRLHAQRPLIVGDRLDTDIEGAARVGCDSLLVLTGVTTAPDLLAARPDHRPTYLAQDLSGLLTAHPAPAPVERGWSCNGWEVTAGSPELELSGAGATIDALRALCAGAWSVPDAPQATRAVRGKGSDATDCLTALGLSG